MLKQLALGAAALAFCVPAGAAFAHDDGYGSFDYYSQHGQDHEEHGDFHQQGAIEHAQAHERGFYGPEEHARWHENADRAHYAFHDDHPDTWHDHYGRGGYYGGAYGGYSPYQNYYHVRHHYYGYRAYRPSVSVYWGY